MKNLLLFGVLVCLIVAVGCQKNNGIDETARQKESVPTEVKQKESVTREIFPLEEYPDRTSAGMHFSNGCAYYFQPVKILAYSDKKVVYRQAEQECRSDYNSGPYALVIGYQASEKYKKHFEGATFSAMKAKTIISPAEQTEVTYQLWKIGVQGPIYFWD